MTHFKLKKPVRLSNNRAVQWADYFEDGYYFEEGLEYIPTRKIKYDNWNPHRYQFYLDAFEAGKSADPIRASEMGGRFSIGDGNHRVAASVHFGYSHVPAIISRKIEEKPPGDPPTDLYEEVYGREKLWLLQRLRSKLHDYNQWLYIEWEEITPDGYSIKVTDERERRHIEMPLKVRIDGDTRYVDMVWGKNRMKQKGSAKGMERAIVKFIEKSIKDSSMNRESHIAERVAARTIRLDKSRIRREAKSLALRVWNDVKKRPEGEPIGKYVINERMTIKNVLGESVPVVIVLKSNPARNTEIVTGGGAGKANGKDAILIQINANLPPNLFNTDRFTTEIEKMLLHELSHIADKFKSTRETRRTVPTEDELDPVEYYNDPTEVRSYMQEVVYDVRQYFLKLYLKFGQKDAMRYALKLSDTWGQISPHLNRRNKNKILSAVWNEVQDLVEEASKESSDGSRGVRTAGLFEAPPAMVDGVTKWVLALTAYREKFFLDEKIKKYEGEDWSNVEIGDMGTYPKKMSFGDMDMFEKHGYESMLRLLKKRSRVLARIIAASPKDVKLFRGRITRAFKLDLSGWKYLSLVKKADPERVKASKAVFPSVKVTVALTDKAGAHWQYVKREMLVRIGQYDIPSSFMAREMRKTVDHELKHFSQDYISIITDTYGKAGLPPKNIRTPEVRQQFDGDYDKLSPTAKKVVDRLESQGITKGEIHDLDDVEFYTELGSAITSIEENLRGYSRDIRKAVILSMMGAGELVRGAPVHRFFKLMKKSAPGKWKKAVKEAVKVLI